jgi:hypothetical protein
MAIPDSKRDDEQNDEIVSLKSRIAIERQRQPAYKRIMKKYKIWVAVLLAAMALSFVISIPLVSFLSLLVSTPLILIWQEPDKDELTKWRKERFKNSR